MRKIQLRVHHIYDFIRALEDKNFREKSYLAVGIGNGNGEMCYTKEEARKLGYLLNSVRDSMIVEVVRGRDDLCRICGLSEEEKERPACMDLDSLRRCRELIGTAVEGETASIRHLKTQYRLFSKSFKVRKSRWRKIYQAHRRYRRRYSVRR
jgi:hypothetical protein